MASITRTTFQSRAFVLRPGDISRLADAFKTHVANPAFEVETSDDLTRKFPTLKTLLQFDNSPKRAITTLEIESRSKDFQKTASVKFSLGRTSNVYIHIDAEEDTVVKLNAIVEDRIAAIRPWYAPLARMDFTIIILLLLSVAFILLVVAVASGAMPGADVPSSSSPRSTALANVIVYGALGGGALLGWLLNKLRHILFPLGTFAMGDGEERFRTLERWRWTVVVGFFVSLAAGAAMTVIG